MSDLAHNATETGLDLERKRCEQCHDEKDIGLFRKVTNQYTGVHPMSICKECYNGNNEALKRKQAEEWEARKTEKRQQQLADQQQLAEWEAKRAARVVCRLIWFFRSLDDGRGNEAAPQRTLCRSVSTRGFSNTNQGLTYL